MNDGVSCNCVALACIAKICVWVPTCKCKGENMEVDMRDKRISELQRTIEELQRDIRALQKMHSISMNLGRRGGKVFDQCMSELSSTRPETEYEERYRKLAGRHFGIEPSHRMHRVYAESYPRCTGIISSPERSPSPSPERSRSRSPHRNFR